MTTKIKTPTVYRGFLLSPRPDGSMDLMNRDTGQWLNAPTQRYAKWTATWLHNVNTKFASNAPKEISHDPV